MKIIYNIIEDAPNASIRGSSCKSSLNYIVICHYNRYSAGFRNKLLGFRVLKLTKL